MDRMGQTLHSYYGIETLSSTASISYRPGEPRSTQMHMHTLNIIIILFICFNCVIPFRGLDATTTKVTSLTPRLMKPIMRVELKYLYSALQAEDKEVCTIGSERVLGKKSDWKGKTIEAPALWHLRSRAPSKQNLPKRRVQWQVQDVQMSQGTLAQTQFMRLT